MDFRWKQKALKVHIEEQKTSRKLSLNYNLNNINKLDLNVATISLC